MSPSRSVPLVLARLKLRLILNAWRRREGVLRGVLGLAVGVIGGLIAFFAALGAADDGDPRIGHILAVLGATGIVVGWSVLPPVTFGADETLDPRRLQLLPLPKGQLMTGLVLASLIGYAPTALLGAAAGAVAGYASGIGTIVVVVAVATVLTMAIAASRALSTRLAATFSSRRGRDVAVAVTAFLAIGVQLLRFLPRGLLTVDRLARAVDFVRWTPPGLAGQAMVDAESGRVGAAVLELVPAIGTVLLLMALWARALDRSLTVVAAGERPARRPSAPSGLVPGVLRWLRPSPRVAVAAKELRLVSRDPRRRVAMLQMVVFGLGLGIWFGTRSSAAAAAVLPANVAAYFGLLGATNQFGFDGAALWMDVVAGRVERAELEGKNLAVVVETLPIVAVVAVVLAAISGGWGYVPLTLLVAIGALGAGLAVANVVSVQFPQRLPDSSNPFAGRGGGQGCVTGVMLLGGMVVQGLLVAPVIAATAIAAAARPAALVVVAPAAAAYGMAVWAGGTAWAASLVRDRRPELVAAVDPRRTLA